MVSEQINNRDLNSNNLNRNDLTRNDLTGPAPTTPALTTPILEFRHVGVGFEQPVLIDINFKLMPGESIVITGEHQSGKSVLLRLANGLFSADQGEILIAGQHIESLDEQALLKIRGSAICLVFQESALFTSLTVFDNVAFRLREHGWAEDQIEPAVTELLRFVNLTDSKDKYYEELSGGMRRRLEIARALVGWPPIMLFDEPTAGLDPITTKQILNLILGARDIHKVSALYVTKELWEIDYLNNHYVIQSPDGSLTALARPRSIAGKTNVLVLKQGRVAFYGNPEQFHESQAEPVLNLTHPQGTIPRVAHPPV